MRGVMLLVPRNRRTFGWLVPVFVLVPLAVGAAAMVPPS